MFQPDDQSPFYKHGVMLIYPDNFIKNGSAELTISTHFFEVFLASGFLTSWLARGLSMVLMPMGSCVRKR